MQIEWHVKTVKVQGYLSLEVAFNDGIKGMVSISPEWLFAENQAQR